MIAEDIFVGPLLRRAEPGLVVICLATFVPVELRFSVREHGKAKWLAHDSAPLRVEVTPNLYFWFARIRPDTPLPTGTVLAYGIAVMQSGTPDYRPFEYIVAQDGLAYGKAPLPTFVLQARGAPLNVLYGSCRKIHDTKGGDRDALADGDKLVGRTFLSPSRRPSVLCLGGDQIYADDVHDKVRDEITVLSIRLENPDVEILPDRVSGGTRDRKSVLKNRAKFTSDDLKNHLVSFCEYLAIYGLMWNGRNWLQQPRELEHFTRTLPQVRRLFANTPTYMIFDDHDVTDDWNLDLKWAERVRKSPLGHRVIGNALMAYWLCQGYGNDPESFSADKTRKLADLIEKRTSGYAAAEAGFWAIDNWEFATPTTPLVYFLDTRTKRGAKDDPQSMDKGAPAFLKRSEAWNGTMKRLSALLARQGPSVPVVLVSAAPVFGFRWVESLQGFVSFLFGAYKYDYENWAANDAHFNLFLHKLAGRNVVVLSGDVHYGYSSTVRYAEFDSRLSRASGPRRSATGGLPLVPAVVQPSYRVSSNAQFLQLCSSAINNYAGGFWTRFPAWLSRTQPAKITTDTGDTLSGDFRGGVFVMDDVDPTDPGSITRTIRPPHEVRPHSLFKQRINDAYNSEYVGNHNLGMIRIMASTVEHCFLMKNGRHSQRRWDFSNARYWE